jgi:hypothetical protein
MKFNLIDFYYYYYYLYLSIIINKLAIYDLDLKKEEMSFFLFNFNYFFEPFKNFSNLDLIGSSLVVFVFLFELERF